MRLTKNKALLTICVFILMIQFVSVALAAKPVKPQPRTATVKYGYAILEDGNGNVITSDLNDQYVDIENVPENDPIYGVNGNKIRVYSYDDNGELIWLRAFIGKPELPYRSPRRANFNFDLNGDAKTKPGEGTAVYDILSDIITEDGASPRGNEQLDGKYYLNNGTVHFVVAIGSCDFFGEGAQNRAMFMVDPGCVAEPPAISQTSVDAFRDDGDPLYWTAIQGASITDGDSEPHDQIAYHLLVNQLSIEAVGVNDKWIITPKTGDVTLQVYEYKNVSNNKNRPNYQYVAVPLAIYGSIPFRLTLSLTPFTTRAPSKEKTSTTLWGEIKSRK